MLILSLPWGDKKLNKFKIELANLLTPLLYKIKNSGAVNKLYLFNLVKN